MIFTAYSRLTFYKDEMSVRLHDHESKDSKQLESLRKRAHSKITLFKFFEHKHTVILETRTYVFAWDLQYVNVQKSCITCFLNHPKDSTGVQRLFLNWNLMRFSF